MSPSTKKEPEPTGVKEIDDLAEVADCTLSDYIQGVSAYVRVQATLGDGPKKAAQIRLSNALARALAHDLEANLPQLRGRLVTSEQEVAGALRTVQADVSESHKLDGLRLAVELKPVNLAVGRAIWNRFGDIRTFAVNLHLKFPFAVVGGVLVIPTYELTKKGRKKETTTLINRAIERLVRAGGRRSEAEAAHLLEGIAVVVYDPDTAEISSVLPEPGSSLRWEEFIGALAASYRARFED